MKRTHRWLARLLPAGMSLALLTGLAPGALAASNTLSYKVDSNKTLEISDQIFNQYCKTETGYGMGNIEFTDLPSSRQGTLYYTSSSSGSSTSRVRDGESIDYYKFYGLVFEPEEDYDGTVTIAFEGDSDDGDYYWGYLEIDVNGKKSSSSSKGDITYEVKMNGTVDLDYDDFDEYCYDETARGETVRTLWFTDLPSSRQGTLYYNYGYSSSEEEVDEDDEFSRKELDDLTFVPARNFEGSVTLSFEGRADNGEKFTGDVVIKVGSGSSSGSTATGDVTYDVDVNDTVDLDYDDFDEYCFDETARGETVDYLWFTSLPSSSKGILYYDYGYSSEEVVDEGDDFDRKELDDLTFVPARNFEGNVTLSFEGRADSGEKFTGELLIRVGSAGGSDVTVSLQAGTGSALTFRPDDFNDACVSETGGNLNYVVFDYDSGRSGSLYYQYGQSSETDAGSSRYYRTSSPGLSDVSFVPGGSTGNTVRIPFTGYSTNGKSFNGEVEIRYVTLQQPTLITYSSAGLAVDFNAADFMAACNARGGGQLVSVRFPAPDTTGGQLYYNFQSPTKYRGEVISSIDYSVNGVYLLNAVTFLPKAGYTGVVTIPYTGTDSSGITYTGNLQIMVSTSTTNRFSDMGSYGWAAPSAEFLAAYGITTGTGTGATFSPSDKLTRGDYLLMLYRTFGFTGNSQGNFTDVPAGIYYADALAAVKALGIATADSSGAIHPTQPVTRQDAMLYLYRAMKAVNRPIPDAYDSYLNRFPDSASIAAEARPAMAAMAQAGVIQGNELGQVLPTGTLSRAEMAVILHRALTL